MFLTHKINPKVFCPNFGVHFKTDLPPLLFIRKQLDYLTALVIKIAILVNNDEIESHVDIERTLLSLFVD